MVKVRFKQLVVSTQFGNLTEGTILACGDAHAAHFVDELGVAERLAPPVVPEPDLAVPAAAEAKARKRPGK